VNLNLALRVEPSEAAAFILRLVEQFELVLANLQWLGDLQIVGVHDWPFCASQDFHVEGNPIDLAATLQLLKLGLQISAVAHVDEHLLHFIGGLDTDLHFEF